MDNNRNVIDIDLEGLKNIKLPHFSGKSIVTGLAVVLGLIIVFGSFYQVQPEEVGVVLRFGKYVRKTDPGLHLKIPFAEEVLKVQVLNAAQLKQKKFVAFYFEYTFSLTTYSTIDITLGFSKFNQ